MPETPRKTSVRAIPPEWSLSSEVVSMSCATRKVIISLSGRLAIPLRLSGEPMPWLFYVVHLFPSLLPRSYFLLNDRTEWAYVEMKDKLVLGRVATFCFTTELYRRM